MIKGIIKKGEYFDSVTLMLVARDINNLTGIDEATVVMGTHENMAILKNANMLVPEIENATDTDLIIVVKATDENVLSNAIEQVSVLLKDIRNKKDVQQEQNVRNFEAAFDKLPDANLVLISINGKYAAQEAMKAIENGLHVMIFSDNVSIEDELLLKQKAHQKNLLVMGPDCGTAIINGVPLAFANVINKGRIGLVGASGTGLQEVTTIISKNGGGISQAIGTGGRDVKKDIGGIMFIDALRALAEDPHTDVITLVSKPPHQDVLQKIAAEIKNINKPVVAIFIGADKAIIEASGAIAAQNLEEAALLSVALEKGTPLSAVHDFLQNRTKDIIFKAKELAQKAKGKYLRGLFSGGTLCDEGQLVLRDMIGTVYSNTPVQNNLLLENVWQSKEHTILDLGDDVFTAGRPHPMIDFSLRNKRIEEEVHDKEVALILFDIVLGYGAHLHPDSEIIHAIQKAKTIKPDTLFVCSITGTEKDPQAYENVKNNLEKAGCIVMSSNVAACELSAQIIKYLN